MKFKILVLITALFLSSCATIVSSSTQGISFVSTPKKADIIINGVSRGRTPAVIDLKRKKQNYKIEIEKEGYESHTVFIDRKINGWVWGNILGGGLIGLVVDYSTGAMYKLSRDQVSIELEKQEIAFDLDNDNLIIMTTLNPKPEWKKIGYAE